MEATLSCLKRYGHEGVSVRRIGAAAGVSIGLINHHFPSKSGLVAVAYETLALTLQDSIRAQADNKAVSPRDRFSKQILRASFAPELLDLECSVYGWCLEHGGPFPEIRAIYNKQWFFFFCLVQRITNSGARAVPRELRLRPGPDYTTVRAYSGWERSPQYGEQQLGVGWREGPRPRGEVVGPPTGPAAPKARAERPPLHRGELHAAHRAGRAAPGWTRGPCRRSAGSRATGETTPAAGTFIFGGADGGPPRSSPPPRPPRVGDVDSAIGGTLTADPAHSHRDTDPP